MDIIHEHARQIPVLASVDVLVVGSGPAGLAAAIAAAREGVTTMIVERYGCFGGVISQVGVEGFAWYRHAATIEAGGLAFEFEREADALGGARPECQSDSKALDAEMFKYVADRMLLKAGVIPLLHCTAVAAIVEDGLVRGIITESKSGRLAIRAERVIDCSGDADVAALAGAPFNKAPKHELMSVTQLFNCCGVDGEAFRHHVETELKPTYKDWGGYWSIVTSGKEDSMFSPYLETPFQEAVKDGLIPKDEGVSLGGTWSSVTPNGDVTQLNVVFQGNIDATDVHDLTRAEIMGRENALRALRVLQERVPGFRQARLRNFGMTLGVRETRKIDGQYTLTEHDVFNEARFEDSIGIYPEFIDGCGYLIIPTTGRYFHLPYRALVPRLVDNLLVAGRSISGDRLAHAAFRNMACCVATGQGAGVAAAVSVKDRVSTASVDIGKVQKSLEKQGVRVF